MPSYSKTKYANTARRVLRTKIRDAAATITENLKNKGRPSLYHPGFCHLAEQTEIIGARNVDLAALFGTNSNVIDMWLVKYPEFKKAVLQGRLLADQKVVNALHHRAVGYVSREEHEIPVGKNGKTKKVIVEKKLPPSEIAIIFWLKNRDPEQWRPDAQLVPAGPRPDDAAALIRKQVAAMDATTSEPESSVTDNDNPPASAD